MAEITKDSFADKYGPWAMVTGAANGLGAEFARQLGARGLDLVLVDVDAESLAATSTAIEEKSGRKVVQVITDLAGPDFMPDILAACEAKPIGLLVNNAGISPVGKFLDQPVETHIRTTAINVTAPSILAHHFGTPMAARKRGGMIFLSSMSALQGTNLVTNYAATKAYNMILAEGLWQELHEHGIDVLGVLPGQIRTPGFIATEARLDRAQGPIMEVGPTVTETLDNLGKRPRHIPGRANRWIAVLMQHLIPRKLAIRFVAKSMEKLYEPRD